MPRQALVAATTLACFFLTSGTAFSAPPPPLPKVPDKPTAPPSMTVVPPPDPFTCRRRFVYQGKTLDCDANVQRDGENLRPVIKEVPGAVSELDLYQSNRRTLRYTAYFASAGLLVAAVGRTKIFGDFRRPDVPDDPQSPMSLGPSGYITLGGLLLSAGTFIYGFTLYKLNEGHLRGAVAEFNKAKPETPIELQLQSNLDEIKFQTGIKF